MLPKENLRDAAISKRVTGVRVRRQRVEPEQIPLGIDGFVMEIAPDEAGPDRDRRFAEDQAATGLQRRLRLTQKMQWALQVMDTIEHHQIARFALRECEIV